jgi:hypothetical protein
MSDGTDKTAKSVDTALAIYDRKRLAAEQRAAEQAVQQGGAR